MNTLGRRDRVSAARVRALCSVIVLVALGVLGCQANESSAEEATGEVTKGPVSDDDGPDPGGSEEQPIVPSGTGEPGGSNAAEPGSPPDGPDAAAPQLECELDMRDSSCADCIDAAFLVRVYARQEACVSGYDYAMACLSLASSGFGGLKHHYDPASGTAFTDTARELDLVNGEVVTRLDEAPIGSIVGIPECKLDVDLGPDAGPGGLVASPGYPEYCACRQSRPQPGSEQ